MSSSRISPRRTLATILLAVGITATAGAPAHAASDDRGKDAVRTCGLVTCSVYYSHNVTVRLDNVLRGPADSTDALAISGSVCALASALSPVTAIPCMALAAVAVGDWNVRRIIHHAATTNGCLRIRTVRGADRTPGAFYADHSDTCHSMS
ncbi:hypothetical protein [Couchioplanes azureus]|uniref:hypothetical protein n=1 Tax=Couchioplanes caeruleus TaxID=56438 RepID=UPI0016708285|nr:hypothetical protein [Couchioplanes caeruleus]GGQ52268.1 hypothetical protein GCM10010166_21540 [Couchioplanes caeruleus subsp. azureus]